MLRVVTTEATTTPIPAAPPSISLPPSSSAAGPTFEPGAPSLYLNRELSWLEFNARVLAEAGAPDVPIYER